MILLSKSKAQEPWCVLYPSRIEAGDDQYSHGILFPDFSGCSSAADYRDEIPAMAQAAVDCHMAGGISILIPTSLAELERNPGCASGIGAVVELKMNTAT